jgi:hypothetical protein
LLIVVASLAQAACDGPVQPEMDRVESFGGGAAQISLSGGTDCRPMAAPGLSGSSSAQITVKLGSGKRAAGAVVMAVSPTAGPVCWGTADANGFVQLMYLSGTAPLFFTVRDEIPVDAPWLEVVPSDPSVDLNLFDDPAQAGERAAPLLLGGTTCVETLGFSWDNYMTVLGGNCTLGEGLSTTVILPAAHAVLDPLILDPAGNPVQGVILAALSPATLVEADLIARCAEIPFLDQAECVASNGPGFVHAMDVTGANGRPTLGLAVGSGPMVLEAIASHSDGTTFFGTIITDGSSPIPTTVLAPGICIVTRLDDASQPSGSADLDIQYTAHGVGMIAQDVNPSLPGAELIPVPTNLVVKVIIDTYGDGGVGEFDLKFRLEGSSRQLRVNTSFSISAPPSGVCSVEAGNGNGLTTTGASFTASCAQVPGTTNQFQLFFELRNLPAPPTEALYTVKTDGDHLDPERSLDAFERGAAKFLDLKPASCPVRLNNDGRWSIA